MPWEFDANTPRGRRERLVASLARVVPQAAIDAAVNAFNQAIGDHARAYEGVPAGAFFVPHALEAALPHIRQQIENDVRAELTAQQTPGGTRSVENQAGSERAAQNTADEPLSPALVEALQVSTENLPVLEEWLPDDGSVLVFRSPGLLTSPGRISVHLETPEGKQVAHDGDYIIKDEQGEFNIYRHTANGIT